MAVEKLKISEIRAASVGLPKLSSGSRGLDWRDLYFRYFLRHSSKLSLFSGGNIPNDGLKKLYLDELKDLYSAENQLVKALPKMAKAASSDELRKGFEQQLERTKTYVERLEQIFRSLDESPKGKKCIGMEGLTN